MPGTPSYQRLFAELKRRRVFRVTAVYGAVSFVVLQAADVLVPALALPDSVTRGVALLLILGFPIALVMAWAFEMTPEGVKRTENAGEGEIEAIVSEPRSRRWPSGVLALAGISALIVGAFFVLRPEVNFRGPREVTAGEAEPAIAVLPFTVNGPESEFWREGMANTLATNLNGLAGLRTVSSRTVLSRWDRTVGNGEAPDLATALDVARQAGAAYAVVGDLVVAGDRTQLSADLFDVRTGEQLGQARSAGSVEGDSAFALIDRFTVEIARVAPTPEDAVVSAADLSRLTTASVEALKAYLEGEAYYRRSDFVAAIEAYQRAVEIDSTFAMAHYRLSKSYGWERGDGTVEGHHETALRLADRLPERERTLVAGNVAFLRGRTREAIDIFTEAARRHPDDVEAWFALGDTYYHLGDQALANPLAESERAFGRALELDPSLGPIHIHLISNAFEMGDSALVRQRLEAFREYAGASPTMRANELAFRIAFGDDATLSAALAALDTVSFEDRNAFYSIGAALHNPRMLDRRDEVLRRQLKTDPDDNVQFSLALGLAEVARLRGRWRDLEAAVADPRIAVAREFEEYRARLAGLPVPDSVVERDLTLTEADTLPDGGNLAGTFLAAERGQVDEVVSQTRRWRALADSDLVEGDTANAEIGRWLAEMAEARAQWAAGDPSEARARLEPLQREATGWQFLVPVNQVQRFWLADLNLELGDTEKAELYYRSLMDEARAVLAVARIRDEAGDTDEAAELYARFIDLWADADPQLQPTVQQARARLQEIVQARG